MVDSSGLPPQTPRLGMVARGVQQQRQVQRMSQQQIMSLKLLAMGSLDLREAIYSHAAENPALEIVRDALASGVGSARTATARFSDNTRYGSATTAGTVASDNFQAALESAEDSRETLQEHLEHQFNTKTRTQDEEALGLALIRNLDSNGFHILSPLSLLDKRRPAQNEQLLQQCMVEIRALDPVGTCTSGVEESLLVQAQQRHNAPRAALLLLDGHLSFLEPPLAEKTLKKINTFMAELAALAFLSPREQQWLDDFRRQPFTLAEIDAAIAFIRTLDPYPARNFSVSQSHFIIPDVYVEKLPLTEADEQSGIVSPTTPTQRSSDSATVTTMTQRGNGYHTALPSATNIVHSFKITLAHDAIPSITVSKDFLALAAAPPPRKKANRSAYADGSDTATNTTVREDTSGSPSANTLSAAQDNDVHRFASDAVRDARTFIESVQFRENTVMRAATEIVRAQLAFFEHGARYLVPLRQKDIAARLGVHEATISRMAKGKYLQCEWGLFEFGYFFTNAVGAPAADDDEAEHRTVARDAPANSKEAVKYEIARILKAHANDQKQLSDQKLADLLTERGIKIARRTVAKYRAELNISSSYSR